MINKFVFVSLFLACASMAWAGEEDAILGIWTTAEGKSKVEIYKCQEKYCGKIVWLKQPMYPADDDMGMAGQAKLDRNNPDESLRQRPILGMNIIEGFSYDSDTSWEDGSIYDPRSGKTYSSKMHLENPGKLELRGYVGIPLFGRTTVWTR